MTDSEIKKALECCATLEFGICYKCPLHENCDDGDAMLLHKLALDLINRQQARIKELEERCNDK